jgi:predicted Zn-ribbon and HTH transcriptional regulator
VPKKQKRKPTAPTEEVGIAAAEPDVIVSGPVQCGNCGYYAGSGASGDPCPTCKKPLKIALPS